MYVFEHVLSCCKFMSHYVTMSNRGFWWSVILLVILLKMSSDLVRRLIWLYDNWSTMASDLLSCISWLVGRSWVGQWLLLFRPGAFQTGFCCFSVRPLHNTLTWTWRLQKMNALGGFSVYGPTGLTAMVEINAGGGVCGIWCIQHEWAATVEWAVWGGRKPEKVKFWICCVIHEKVWSCASSLLL
jgi:hypothetical protein